MMLVLVLVLSVASAGLICLETLSLASWTLIVPLECHRATNSFSGPTVNTWRELLALLIANPSLTFHSIIMPACPPDSGGRGQLCYWTAACQ